MKTLLTIWIHPIRTFWYLEKNEDSGTKFKIDLLFYLGTLAMAIPVAPQSISKYISKSDLPGILWIIVSLIAAMVSAFIGALVFKYVHSYVMWIIGKLLQGKASKFQIQLVLAYAMIPGLISLFFSLVLMIMALVMNDINILTYQNPFTLFLIWVFGLRTLIFGIATFNRFSYGYALLNLVIAIGLIQGTMMLLKYLIS